MNIPSDTSWHWLLELKLRQMNGNAFQAFFSDVMEARHGSLFVRAKPYRSLGDSGCDGYLTSTGDVYACYGAQNGAAPSVRIVVDKLNDDFQKAKDKLSGIMKHWHMTHNFVEGTPVEAIQAIEALKSNNSDLELSFFAPPSFRQLFSELGEEKRTQFLGPSAQNRDFQKIQIGDVRDLVDGLIDSVENKPLPSEPITPVSPDKLAYNNIPQSATFLLQSGRVNAPHIAGYFDQHADVIRGERTAQIFRNKYAELAAQSLSSGTIMAELYSFIAGPGNIAIPRQVAAYSILSYLFESCDIFENVPPIGMIS
jgi:hypothetical protein